MSKEENLAGIAGWRMFAADVPSPGEPDTTWNSRQTNLYWMMQDLVRYAGKFDKSSGADGAHYFDLASNPFKDEGLMCQNCAYFESDGDYGTCEMVEGVIEHSGLCKLWLIPESLVEDPQQAEQAGYKLKKPKKKMTGGY